MPGRHSRFRLTPKTHTTARWKRIRFIASCLIEAGEYRLAYVHAESALSGAISHGYPTEEIDLLIEFRDIAKSWADAQN